MKASVKPATDGLQRLRMSYEEYLERFDENAHVEWENGRRASTYRRWNHIGTS